MTGAADPPLLSKALPPPPPLPFPPLSILAAALAEDPPSSDLALDDRSEQHLTDIVRQSLANVKLQDSDWLDPILNALHNLSAFLTPPVLSAVVESHVAEWKSADLEHRSDPKGGAKPKDKKGKGKESPILGDEGRLRAAEERRSRWRAARELLERTASPASTPTPDGDPPREDGEATPKLEEPVGTGVETELPRLTHFRLLLHSTEAGATLLRTGAAIGVVYESGDWTGNPMFGRDSFQVPEPDDLEHLSLVGGTLHLTALRKDITKLERVLELAAFTLLSLKLEGHLLRDTACPRPVLEIDAASDASSVVETPPPPESIGIPEADSFPSEEWPVWHKKKMGHKPKWSASSFWGLIRGPSSSASTASSASSIASVPPTPASKIKDRLRGMGGGLKLKRTRTRRRDGSDGSNLSRPSMDLEALDTWDFIGGLGLAGLGFANAKGLPRLEEAPKKKVGGEVRAKKELPPEEEPKNSERFQKVIKKMEACILSTSPNVIYPPPHLLVRLRKQEIAQLAAQPPSDEWDNEKPLVPPKPPPFLSPLGWPRPPVDRLRSYTTVDARALAMGFASGHPLPDPSASGASYGAMSSGTSQATRITLDARAGLASLLTNNNSLGGTIRHQSMHFLVETSCPGAGPTTPACKPPQWLSFNYWDEDARRYCGAKEGRPDVTLGQLVERLVANKDAPCDTPGCKYFGIDHCTHWMHSKERISVSISTIPSSPLDESEPIVDLPLPKFETTRPRIGVFTTCRTCHAQTPVSLLSAAAYAFSFAKYAELVLYDSDFVPLPELCDHASTDRNALVRSFVKGRTVVSLGVEQIELFELRLPTSVDPLVSVPQATPEPEESSLQLLRNEIHSFYASVHERLDSIEELVSRNSSTIKAAAKGGSANKEQEGDESDKTVEDLLDESGHTTLKSPVPAHLLRTLHRGFEQDEAALFGMVDDLASSQLNQVRYPFVGLACGAKARIAAWETKHAVQLGDAGANSSLLPPPTYSQPEYFDSRILPIPIDSSVLVRDTELSSVIALTLSAPEFQEQVYAASSSSSRHFTPSSYFDTPTHRHFTPSSFFDTPTPDNSRRSSRHPIPAALLASGSSSIGTSPKGTPAQASSSTTSQSSAYLDPDDPNAKFDSQTPDDHDSSAKLQKETRSGSMILSLRGIARQKSTDSFNFFRSPIATPTGEEVPSIDDKRKTLSDSVLEDLVATAEPRPPPAPPLSPRLGPTSSLGGPPSIISKRHVSEATTTSSLSFPVVEVELTKAKTGATFDSISSTSSRAPSITEHEPSSAGEETETDDDVVAKHLPSVAERPGSRIISAASAALGLLPGFPSSIRRSPKMGGSDHSAHIKFKFRQGDKAFRVTAYHAEEFQALRTRCGLSEDLFIESLSRCTDLNPSGGKSKSAFWMTGDKRFMLKELVTAWGVSEKDAFLTFAPELLSYLMAPERPSLLAKIFGFYTVKTKDIKTGETRKLDLICMEHLFHSQTITRQFDLKGVASRVAKHKAASAGKEGQETLWDADWLSGSLQSRLLIYSHSKTLLRDALLNDSSFLAKCGNIDYSLLVGVNDTTHELVVGLIDIISVFNLAKMLENAGKTALKKATAADADTVTVLPPGDYALRFRQAMEKYFIAVPEKFSRGVDEIDPDPRLAPIL